MLSGRDLDLRTSLSTPARATKADDYQLARGFMASADSIQLSALPSGARCRLMCARRLGKEILSGEPRVAVGASSQQEKPSRRSGNGGSIGVPATAE